MAEYNPSKIIKDGNTYNFRDTTKIPLAGTNALAGSIVPDTDNAYDFGTSMYNFKMLYTKGITINGTQFLPSDYIPKAGGAVMTGDTIGRVDNTGNLNVCGGTSWDNGGFIALRAKNSTGLEGTVLVSPRIDSSNKKEMYFHPNGTWTWDGQAVQITSDQRLKQQITEIDDKLLDAWEDVELVQFKYNDAVDQKGDNARLHTGYVVQQINKACASHDVDISAYGLYCHEEYPEETEEVEVENEDGTKIKERKVIREASEHYSLRYTEALIVECAYLRKKLKELTARIEQLESSK